MQTNLSEYSDHSGNSGNSEYTADLFNRYRKLLFSIAYRMLGSATEAEDMVQETFVRWLQADDAEVASPKGYLTTVLVRLCIDQLRSARAKRETYTGPWLPEPLETTTQQDLAETVAQAESLSFAFLIMLERLNPLERAVFVLREVFDYSYAEIAEITGKSEANCRQILHRAQQHLAQERPRVTVSREQQEQLTTQFLYASASGNMQGLLALLANDVTFIPDSGGKVPTAGRRPVQGRENVARGMLGALRKVIAQLEGSIIEVNGQPAIVGYIAGEPYAVMLFDINGDKIQTIYAVLNPDKLRRLAS